jgi:hypothetical protein
MLNNFFTIGFRAKNSIDRVKEVIPKEIKIQSYLTFDLKFKVKRGQFVDFGLKMSVTLKK